MKNIKHYKNVLDGWQKIINTCQYWQDKTKLNTPSMELTVGITSLFYDVPNIVVHMFAYDNGKQVDLLKTFFLYKTDEYKVFPCTPEQWEETLNELNKFFDKYFK